MLLLLSVFGSSIWRTFALISLDLGIVGIFGEAYVARDSSTSTLGGSVCSDSIWECTSITCLAVKQDSPSELSNFGQLYYHYQRSRSIIDQRHPYPEDSNALAATNRHKCITANLLPKRRRKLRNGKSCDRRQVTILSRQGWTDADLRSNLARAACSACSLMWLRVGISSMFAIKPASAASTDNIRYVSAKPKT